MPQVIKGYLDYITEEGDTWDSLALALYNEERLSSALMAENPDHCDVLIFEAGVFLRLPVMEYVKLPESLPPWRREE